MKNWTQRFGVRAVFAILVSAAMLVGCSNNQTPTPDQGKPVAAGNSVVATDSAGKPINPTNP